MSHSRSSLLAPADSAEPSSGWTPVSQPPDRYEFVRLRFADGRTRRGTWNGRLWWGYDEAARRSRALTPVAWQPFEA